MLTAIVRAPASTLIDACELTFIERNAISMALLDAQHLAYRQALADCGAKLILLDAIPALPDSVFVEDTAIVLDELAIITRPGTPVRQLEVAHIEPVIAQFRRVERIHAPGTLDGGDVLRVGRTLLVGHSVRTNAEGIAQLQRLAQVFGYQVQVVHVTGSLHLKTACTALDGRTLLVNPNWLASESISEFNLLSVASDEPFAANTLPIANSLIVNSAYPKTLGLIQGRGFRVVPVDISEFGKAEAGLTCLSLLFN
jgi:dimethylargininase